VEKIKLGEKQKLTGIKSCKIMKKVTKILDIFYLF